MSISETQEMRTGRKRAGGGPDISNLARCTDDARDSGLDPDAGPPDITDFATLRGKLEAGRLKLPPKYQSVFVEPFIAKLDELGPSGFTKLLIDDPQHVQGAGLVLDMAKAVTEKADGYLALQTDAFEELVSDLYDGFLSAEDRGGIAAPKNAVVAPLVKWGNPDDGPYTWPIDATRAFGAGAAVVNLPPANARKGILAWAALGHETAGHDILHAYAGLLDELTRAVRAALGKKGLDRQGSYWSRRIDETAADVMGILNMGPAAGIGLIGYFRGLNGAFTGVEKLRNDGPASDPHPADVVRGYLASEVVRRLKFSRAGAWADLIAAETDKDVGQIVLAGQHVTKEDAKTAAAAVAETLVEGTWNTLQGHALSEVQNWSDEDQELTEALIPVLNTASQLPDVPSDTFYAAHVVAAGVTGALQSGANINGIMGRMLLALKKLHDTDPNWGPLYVAHRGDIRRDLAYARHGVRVELVERFTAARSSMVS